MVRGEAVAADVCGPRTGDSPSAAAVATEEADDGCRAAGRHRVDRDELVSRSGRGHAERGGCGEGAAVAGHVARIFERLYRARFPIRRIVTIAAYGGSDDRSLAADNTSAFNCRSAVAPGPKRWSVHAYGEAIDVNPVENPYLEGGRVLPPAGRRYVDRTIARRGMAVSGGVLVAAFAAEGWQWGGRWSASPDRQHFSASGG
jgi:hypothetical protein